MYHQILMMHHKKRNVCDLIFLDSLDINSLSFWTIGDWLDEAFFELLITGENGIKFGYPNSDLPNFYTCPFGAVVVQQILIKYILQ